MRGRERRLSGDGGFTLIELMVVVLVISILLAIAIPTYLGARRRANDRATQLTVRNAFVAARIYYNGAQTYTADPVAMNAIDPALTWTNTLPDGTESGTTVYIEVQDVPTPGQTVVLVGRSKSGKCYIVRDAMAGSSLGTFFNEKVPAGAACSVPAASDPAWGDNWSL